MEREEMPMTLCGYTIPSKDIKISKQYLASDGWRWYIDVADYGWAIFNAPGYETYTKDGYKNNLGYEKNFEEAYQWLLGVCERNNWTLKELEDSNAEEIVDSRETDEEIPLDEDGEALKYGKWYPINVYYENQDKLDWALVQFKEIKTGFMPLPFRAKFLKRDGVWITHSDNDRYLCELCEPIAFMLWQPYEEINNE